MSRRYPTGLHQKKAPTETQSLPFRCAGPGFVECQDGQGCYREVPVGGVILQEFHQDFLQLARRDVGRDAVLNYFGVWEAQPVYNPRDEALAPHRGLIGLWLRAVIPNIGALQKAVGPCLR